MTAVARLRRAHGPRHQERQDRRAAALGAAARGRGDRQHVHEQEGAVRLLREGARALQEARPAVLAARQGDDDEGLAPDRVRPRGAGVLQGPVRQARQAVRRARRQRQQRLRQRAGEDQDPAGGQARGDRGRHQGLRGEAAAPVDGRFGQGHQQPLQPQRRHRRRLDAGDDPRRRHDVGAGRQDVRDQGGAARVHLRAHLPGGHQLLQDQRRLRPEDHGHGAQRRPDGAAGRGIRLARQDLRDPGGRRGAHRRQPRRPRADGAERRGRRHLAHVPDQGRRDPRLGQARGHARAAVEHAGGVLAGRIPPARERADQEGAALPQGPRHRPAWTSRSCRRCARCASRWSA